MSNGFQTPRRLPLGEFLLSKGIITLQQLQTATESQKSSGDFMGEVLIALGYVPPATLGACMEELTTFPFIELTNFPVNKELLDRLPESYIRSNHIIPFAEWDDAIQVAMSNPLRLSIVDDLRDRLKRRIVPYYAFKSDIIAAINRVYGAGQKGADALSQLNAENAAVETAFSTDDLESMAEEAPIVRLVNGIIENAVAGNASDIHIEPQEKNIRVRFRQDGVLIEHMTFPRLHLHAVISRIKIMATLNIAERRRPQDGRATFNTEEHGNFDLRVSIMPLVHGESVVMRILDKKVDKLNLKTLGMEGDDFKQYHSLIRQPHGIILVTGPTGSGKTTTLYASLMEIASPEIKIMTVEDPVEYEIGGINQLQVVPKIGLGFSEALRGIVRQDPDVILVGEIRDKETAEIAIQAALTGHLVLSTLHTNDAPGAIVRLQNMGVEPFLISSALLGVMAQRLLRTVCPHCKELKTATRSTISAWNLPYINGKAPQIATGKGCSRCNNRGMKGRTAVYEFMEMSEPLRELTLARSATSRIRAQAIKEGMLPMRDFALKKVSTGHTTLQEVSRVLFEENTAPREIDHSNGAVEWMDKEPVEIAASMSQMITA